jgi:hypothetical protein
MESSDETKKISSHMGFFKHVFNFEEDSKSEILNIIQYAFLSIIPIVILNKLSQKYVPEADEEKGNFEILAEIIIQILVIFLGILLIHRIITYIPTYSGFKYENLNLTNVILAFLIIVLSIQTKMGIKVNILFDRISELWNGSSDKSKKTSRSAAQSSHAPSQADYLDNSMMQSDMFPAAPVASQKPSKSYDNVSPSQPDYGSMMGPMAANSVLGGSFGSFF